MLSAGGVVALSSRPVAGGGGRGININIIDPRWPQPRPRVIESQNQICIDLKPLLNILQEFYP